MSEIEMMLRPWRHSDQVELASLANDRRIWLNLRDRFPHPYSVADANRFIEMTVQMKPQTSFAIVVSGAVAGGIGYTLQEDVERISAEVGYWLGVSFWGRSVATRAVRSLTSTAFSSHPELRRLYALPFASNPASQRVLEKAGWQREGMLRESAIKDGIVLNQCIYAILRSEAEGAPPGLDTAGQISM